MKKYKVTIWRTVVATVEVEAEDKEDAVDKIMNDGFVDVDWESINDDDYQVEEE